MLNKFKPHWSTLKKLIWLKGAGIIGGASAVWKTVTGALIHITDALASPTQKFEVTLEPQQDLHGQDAPYPAGGGKNKLKVTAETTTKNGVTFTVNSDGTISVSGSLTSGSSTFLTLCQLTLPAGSYVLNGSLNSNSYLNISGKVNAYNGADASFSINEGGETITVALFVSDGFTSGTAKPMIRLATESDPTFAPYENICPITGWTGTTATRTGKNHFTTTGETTGYFLDSDCDELASSSWNCSDYIVVLPNTQYTFNPNSTAGNSAKAWYFNTSKEPISYIASGQQTFTTPANCAFMRFSYRSTSTDIQLELGSTATDYETFQTTTYSVTFPNIVYGGTFDFVSGGLKPYKEYDSYNGETLTGEWMSSIDKYVSGTTPTIGAQVVDLDGFETTVQLTPQEISTLAGENNVWSNGDSVKMTYKARG